MRAQVVLLHEKRILLARHERAEGSYWVLPGGSIEADEAPEAAAIREVREETGLEIKLVRLLFVDGPRDDGRVVIREPRYTYLGRIVGGALRPVEDRAGGHHVKGHLCGAAWMPFDFPGFDSATQDTLSLVQESLTR